MVMGVALSQYGNYGAQIALREINAAGGIDGVPMEAIFMQRDPNASIDAKTDMAWAQKFAGNDELIAVIGHANSVATLGGASLYNQAKLPHIVTQSTNPEITNIGGWTYRLCLSDKVQGPSLAEHAVKRWGKRKIAVIYANDDYGRGLSEAFTKRALELGAEIVQGIMHNRVLTSDDKDFLRLRLERLKREDKPDLIALFLSSDAGLWILDTLHQLGIQTGLLGGDTLAKISFARDNKDRMEGMHLSQFFFPKLDDARCAAFIKNYRELDKAESNHTSAALAYDAAYLLRDAILHGGYNRGGVKSYLDRLIREKTAVAGVSGIFVIGPDHDAKRSLYIVEVHNGNQHLIDTSATE
jgi:branched-chain amino acid transport system substrate-binding protein